MTEDMKEEIPKTFPAEGDNFERITQERMRQIAEEAGMLDNPIIQKMVGGLE